MLRCHFQILNFIAIFLLSGSLLAKPAEFAPSLQKARTLYLEGKAKQAVDHLKNIDHKHWSQSEIALKFFTLGVWTHELEMWSDSNEFLKESLNLDKSKEAYIHYLTGVNQRKLKNLSVAIKELDTALKHKPPQNIKNEVRFELTDIAIEQKNWNSAYRQLAYLERSWRNTQRHPEVLWRLIKVEQALKRKWRACRWARKIYSQYPSHPLVFDWSIDLQSSRFEGEKLGCLPSLADQRNRIRRLQWAGESERARQEIEILKSRAKDSVSYDVDSLLAQFLYNEGFVDEAMKVLLRHYKQQNQSFNYLMMLGNAAARAGEYQTAVGAFYKAHKLKPRSSSGRTALFQAAFLSYQFQDYDGAARKFEMFRSLYENSGLSRDAQWHLAWIRYLKGDYEGAAKGFNSILEARKKKSRQWRNYPPEKIQYWLAMSYLRQERYDLAKPLFQELMSDRLIGFYSIAALNRYNSIPEVKPVKNLSSFDRDVASLTALRVNEIPPAGQEKPKEEVASEESESEETLAAQQEEAVNEESTEENKTDVVELTPEENAELTKEEEEDKAVVTTFTDPQLAKRFQIANDLINAGLNEWAKWELFEIERRTRNPEYLKMLMRSYDSIQSYNRSSYLSEVYFSSQRREHGLSGVRYLWEYAYPRAYRSSVEKFSEQFAVPSEFIWAIMRAESHFKPDVISPVGAKGLMQIMPHTARQVASLMGNNSFHERELTAVDVNLKLGTRYLQRLLKKFEGQVPLAAAGYNAGPHRVESWLSSFGNLEMDEFIEHIPFIETRNYVKKVLRNYAIYQDLYASPKPLTWLAEPVPVKVSQRPSPRETWESID